MPAFALAILRPVVRGFCIVPECMQAMRAGRRVARRSSDRTKSAIGLMPRSPRQGAESPHCDARSAGQQPELIVVHGISLPPGRYGRPWIDRPVLRQTCSSDADPYFAQIAGAQASRRMPKCAAIRSSSRAVPTADAWHAGVHQLPRAAAPATITRSASSSRSDFESPYEGAAVTSRLSGAPGPRRCATAIALSACRPCATAPTRSPHGGRDRPRRILRLGRG